MADVYATITAFSQRNQRTWNLLIVRLHHLVALWKVDPQLKSMQSTAFTRDLFFWHFWDLEEYIIQGTFDQFLLRPISPFIQFLGREVQYIGFADMSVAIAGIALAYANLDLHWSLTEWLFFPLVVLSGTIIETALTLMTACIAFWTGRSGMAIDLIMEFNVLVQHYPIDIFGLWFRVVVTGIIPVAFMNYYPSLLLLDKYDPKAPYAWMVYLSPVVALVLSLIASRVWNLAIRRYASSGG